MDDNKEDLVVPVISEELHADAVPVVTGGVRVTKRVHTHDELLEQQLRESRAEVKRVKTNRVVDGPQPVQRVGDTLVIPVVCEVLHIEKRWIVTEEIHVTQIEATKTVQQTVPVSHEEATIERLDESGNPVSAVEPPAENAAAAGAGSAVPISPAGPDSILERRAYEAAKTTQRKGRSLLNKPIR